MKNLLVLEMTFAHNVLKSSQLKAILRDNYTTKLVSGLLFRSKFMFSSSRLRLNSIGLFTGSTCTMDQNLTLESDICSNNEESSNRSEDPKFGDLLQKSMDRCADFMKKLDSNSTVVPTELLLEASHLASERTVVGNVTELVIPTEYVDVADVTQVLNLSPMSPANFTECISSHIVDNSGLDCEYSQAEHKPDSLNCATTDYLLTMHSIESIDEAGDKCVSKDDNSLEKNKNLKNKNKRKRTDSSSVLDEQGDGESTKMTKRPAPNCFLAIQIKNKKIHENLFKVQNSVVKVEPRLESALISLPTLHLTLMVLKIDDESQMESAKLAMENSKVAIKSLDKLLPVLSLSGIGNFKNSVVFTKLSDGLHLENLREIVDLVINCFEVQGLSSTDPRPFTPHITLMKMSKDPKLWRKGLKKIDPQLYSEYVDDHFGDEPVVGIQLCSMFQKKDKNGYYHVIHQINLESIRNKCLGKCREARKHKYFAFESFNYFVQEFTPHFLHYTPSGHTQVMYHQSQELQTLESITDTNPVRARWIVSNPRNLSDSM